MTARMPGPARQVAAAIASALLALLVLTALGALLSTLDPALAPSQKPHPTLRPTWSEIGSILASNVRVLAAPFILTASRFQTSRFGRIAGDAIVTAILASNAARVGLAIGRWGTRLLPFIPQLPLEYLAASIATAAWVHARERGSQGQPPNAAVIAASAVLCLSALAAGAVAEVLLTPHPS